MANFSTSGTANTAATTVTLAVPHNSVLVLNRGTVDLWVRADGTDASVAGDDNYVVQSGQSTSIRIPSVASFDQGSGQAEPTTTSVSVAASAACPFTVVGQ